MKKFLTIIALSFFCMSSVTLPVFANCEGTSQACIEAAQLACRNSSSIDCGSSLNGKYDKSVIDGVVGGIKSAEDQAAKESRIDLYAPFSATNKGGDVFCKRPPNPAKDSTLPGNGGYVYEPYNSSCESQGGVRVQRLTTARTSEAILGAYLGLVFRYALGLGVGASVLMVVFGGIKMITAFGEASAIGDAKNFIIQGGAGLAILVLAATILHIINPNFFQF